MAISYQAKIDLIVGGLEKIEAAEKRIKSLLRESRKLQRGGIAQRGTAALAATTRESRQQERSRIRTAERRLELQSKLNSATDLYNRKLQQFQRAGGAGNKQLQGRVDQITQAFAVGTKEGTKNLRLTRALATELGRVVEQQRELNRARAQGNKGFEAGRRGFERISALRASGFGAERQISGAESLVRKIGPAAASGDQAAFNEAVRKAEVALRRLEREFQQAERAQRASTKAKRDVERAERRLANEAKKDARDRANRRKRRFQDIATGAGFPLLFGGGPVQALAGGIGGALGGFGGSIAATALVGQAEAFARAAAETGVALTSTGGALEFMREKSLFSTEAAKERAAELEELGRVEELAAHLGQEMANAIGNNGVKALQDLGETTKETTRLWNLLTTQLFRLVAGPLDAFLKAINQVLGGITTGQQFAARREDLGAEGAAALDARVAELVRGDVSGLSERQINRGVRGVGAMSLVEARKQALSEEQFQVTAAPIPITAQDRRDITPGKAKAGRRSRVPDLNAEIKLQERLLTLNNQIAQAKRDENPVREAALQMEVALEKEAAKIAQIEAKRIPEVEKVLEKQLLQVQTSQELASIQSRLNDAKAQEAEKAQEVLSGLLDEQALLQATLDGRKEEEQIRQRLAEIMKQNPTLAQAEVQAILEGNQALREKITLQQQQDQLYAQIGQTINSGIVNGIQSAIDGSKSLGESLSGILKSLAGIFLQAGIGSFGVGGNAGSGLLGLLKFSEGGYVSGPTPALVGEGGESEYIIPESKMRESMSRYSRGARGSSVIPEAGGSGTSGEGGGTAVAAPIDVRYSVERINSVDYVTADQFQAGMRQAASQGAKQGEQQTLRRLQMSGSTRKRVGM